MTRGEKAAATRRANKMRDISKRDTSKKGKAKGMRKPKNWDAMSRGEKASWTRKANERAKKRETDPPKSGSRKRTAPPRDDSSPKRGRGRGRGRGRDKGEKSNRSERMPLEAAKRRLERIRSENPDLAAAIEEEAEARHARVKAPGGFAKGMIVESLSTSSEHDAGSIVKEGSIGGRILDGTIVIGTGMLSARLDDMIKARPLGLEPSDLLLLVETLVLGFAAWKRNRKVARYAALAATGTMGMKVVRAIGRRKAAPSP